MINKSIIGPLVAFACLVIGAIFHISIDTDVQQMIVEAVVLLATGGYTLYGIFKNHFQNKE